MNKPLFVIIFLSFLLFRFSISPVFAQDIQVGPTYTIQPGDTLGVIASKFGVSIDDIITINNIENPNILAAGQQIVIPGLEGVTGNLTAETIPLGSSLTSLSVKHQFPVSMLIKLNKITSPEEVYAGSSLILPVTDQISLNRSVAIQPGESILETAAQVNQNPWIMILQNNLEKSWLANPAIPLLYAGNSNEPAQQIGALPFLTSLYFDKLPIIQGQTVKITATGEQGLYLTGSLSGKELHFSPTGDGRYVALQGISALTDPGLVDFSLAVKKTETSKFEISQKVLVQSGFYPEDPPLSVDPQTIDPIYTEPEEQTVKQITSTFTPQQLWSGQFRDPVDDPCYKSIFGVRRIYNGGAYLNYHGGLDYGVCANLNIYAPAAGTVVFTGPLTALGNATYIDHGLGIFTGYGHQAEILVNIGDHVEPGQQIGIIGATGRVTGPHLHWEIWANGVRVNPVQWLENTYP
ncbi:MAG: peptidoglycan DD-metalloendopeptidase family protein [Leptolinea sp.]|nr:peptidoglycan DD-metalloendopeptidase family protein [Leptolinea sp.]